MLTVYPAQQYPLQYRDTTPHAVTTDRQLARLVAADRLAQRSSYYDGVCICDLLKLQDRPFSGRPCSMG